MNWWAAALISAAATSLIFLSFKQLTVWRQDIPSFLALIFGVESIVFWIIAWMRGRIEFPSTTKVAALVASSVIAGVVANYFLTTSIRDAPNHGYSVALQEVRLILLTLLSIPLFGSEFSPRKLAGITVILLGSWMVIR